MLYHLLLDLLKELSFLNQGPRHLNEEYFKKKEARDDSPDRHQTEFHARLPENLQHVVSSSFNF